MPRPALDKVYDPKKVEDKWYAFWMERGLFHADAAGARPKYTIMIPPPNVTGMLTMGHILNNTLQDVLIRWKRMQGMETLWMPGTDHAGIATQNRVEASLKAEKLTRHDLGRERLIERVWKWKDEYGGIILKQLRKLGASCDWERERFTMDPGLSRAVREVFVRLFQKGLIYKDRGLINWCPRCHTALSDEEAPNADVNGKFWHIVYPLDGSDETITVSTTRPETMLGDTAVAVHPDDERYRHLIGRMVRLPLTDRLIPIVADDHADPEKGSGAVKVTPAHDFDDFEVARRHHLELLQVMDSEGCMNEAAGKYKGKDRFRAREEVLQDLAGLGLLKGEEPRITPIPQCYRCDTVVEPYLSDQWFVRMKPLAEPAVKAVREGRIRFHPKHWEETYFHWMENIRDWCISRQIWWGHRIPVYTCGQGHVFASVEEPQACPGCGDKKLAQDPDVLDTWFSSWLWPFSTLGWPEKTEDLKAFFPTDALVTGPDIIFFWVARMIMAAGEFMGDIPFRDVYFNGMIRDLSGRKMSKSLGNSPDPLWLIDGASAETVKEFAAKNPSYKGGVPAYGADAVRFTMVYLTPLGGDIHFDHPLVEMGQKFSNKLWNAARFVLMNLDDSVPDLSFIPDDRLDLADRWILSRLNRTAGEVQSCLDSFRFNDAVHVLHGFIWGEFCDWYLELVKTRLYDRENAEIRKAAQAAACHVLDRILRLLHPFMPFISEEIWQALQIGDKTKSILESRYPAPDPAEVDEKAEQEMDLVQKVIGAVRNIRGELNVPQEKKARLLVRGDGRKMDLIRKYFSHVQKLAGLETVDFGDAEKPRESATALAEGLELVVPLEGLIDLKLEQERIRKEMERISGLLAGLEKKLSNEDFIRRAPKEVVEKERQKQADFAGKLRKLGESLELLEGSK